MPRVQNISKYWVSRASGASASSNAYAMLTPCSGICWMPLTNVGAGRAAASRTVAATSRMWWKLAADFAARPKAVGQVHDRPVAGATEMRGDLLGPLIRGVHRVRPANRVVVVGL